MKHIAYITGIAALSLMAYSDITQAQSSTNPSGSVNNSTANPDSSNAISGNAIGDAYWESENKYWRSTYPTRAYYSSAKEYSVYEPAYRYGVDIYNRNPDKPYTALNQSELRGKWDSFRGNSTLSWEDAEPATRDAYEHMATQKRKGGDTLYNRDLD